MSRDVLTIRSTMRIPLLYRGEYSQWVERFMNYLKEQTDGEAMINSIKNGDQPLPRVTQVSIAGTTSTEQPPLKDKSMWSDQEKRVQKIDCLARSLLIQGLPNDIYSLIDSNKIAKDLYDALARHMLGSEYGEQEKKAVVLYEYETFKATEGELLLDTYIRYLQQNQGDVNEAMGSKKKTVVVTSDPLALFNEKTNVSRSKEKVAVSSDSKGSEADDFKLILIFCPKVEMSRDLLIVGSTMRISLLYRGEYSQWVERFMNYLEEQTDGEAMINSIKNGDQPLHRVTQVFIARTTSTEQPHLKDKSMCNKTAKDLWDALARHMLGSEYGEQDRKAAVLYEYETFKATEGELLLDTYIRYLQVINDLKKCGYLKDNCELNFKFLNNLQPEWKRYATIMRQNKNLMDINIDALYNILKQNQGDVNDAMGSKKKTIVVTSDPLALIAEKTNVSRSKEKVVVSSDSEGSEADDFSELKKITALVAKAFNRRKFYSKPTNNNLRTSSSYQSANKKQEFVKSDDKKVDKKADEKKRDMSKVKCYNCKKEGHFAKDCKKAKVKDYEYYKTKMLLAKKDKDEQVLLTEDQAWMESSSDSDQEINANMVFMAQIEKVLFDSEASSSSADEKISKVSYYLSEYESESEFETSEYYDNFTNYGLFMNNDDDQEIFHDAIEYASENFIENHIDSQKNYDKSDVDHNYSKEKEQLVDKLIRKFNKKIVKCQNHVEKANQQSKDFENQNKDLQDKYDVLKNQTTTFEMNNKELNEQLKELIEKNNDFLAQTELLKEELQVKHVVIDTHVECHEKYAKLEAERYEYMIRYYAYFDNDKQHRKQIAYQQVLFDKMSVQMVELDKHEKYAKLEAERYEYMIRYSAYFDNDKQHMKQIADQQVLKGIAFENLSYFEKAKDLRPTLYDEKVIGPGYTPMFLTHSDEALEIEKFKKSRENKIEFAYDYGNLNASYVNEKINFEDDYFQEIINPDFEKIDSLFQKTSSLKPYVPNVILEKIIIDLEDEVVNLLEKEKVNMEIIESLKSKSFESSEKV
nr:hypothetical protein [Tanacetum cinerariifolium]